MKILIAEDDNISRRTIQKILSRFGTCDTVVDGAEAIEAFKLAWDDNAPYDLLCLDIMMPKVDGQQALKQIREIEKQMGIRGRREAKVLMLTALDDPRSVVEAYYRGGATSYLVKPVEIEKLFYELKQLGLLDEAQAAPLSAPKGKRMKKIRVLIVDDSAIVRNALTEIVNGDPRLEVMAVAADPFIAADKIRAEVPDVITLDLEMPRMDGLTFLEKIMSQHPIPVVMCSSLTVHGSESALRAMDLGALEIIAKPRIGTRAFLEESRIRICDVIAAAAGARLKRIAPQRKIEPKLTADAVIAKPTSHAMVRTTEKVVAVGASTGGTEALRFFLEMLPADSPGIVIVQHMPEHFTRAFAERLNKICQVSVKEAENDDTVIRGRALIAPGNRHTLLKRSGARYYVEIKDGPLVSRHRPSVDVLFRSTARYAGANAVGVIMTGMGDDGAQGMLEMKEAGAFTIAQDEESCIVFGMPKEAIKKGGVDKVLDLKRIAETVLRQCV